MPKICFFKEVKFNGHIDVKNEVRTDPKNTDNVRKTTRKTLQSLQYDM